MEDKKLGRREFLKLALASAAATGLSHFQFLNLAAASGDSPLDACHIGAPISDVCNPGNNDPDHGGAQPNCDPYGGPSDDCNPPDDPDLCDPSPGERDECDAPDDTDYQCNLVDDCTPTWGDPDLCNPSPGPDREPDVCQPWAPEPTTDECDPANGDEDVDDDCPGGGQPDPDYPDPTAVEMASFSARWTGQGVLAEWETATELDNLGFNLYRSTRPQAGYAKLNAQLIPSQAPGNPIGASYSFLDSGLEPGLAYFYVLEAVDVHGQVDRYGPAEAAPLKRLLPIRLRPSPRQGRNLSSR